MRGNLLFEAGIGLGLLTFIGIILLKMSLNILAPRQWSLWQTVVDAYITHERAMAERVPFDDLLADDSLWPEFPDTNAEPVVLGRLPGGKEITGTITRTRMPATSHLLKEFATDQNDPDDTPATNPAAIKAWSVKSVVTYQIGNRNYAKARTVLRSQ